MIGAVRGGTLGRVLPWGTLAMVVLGLGLRTINWLGDTSFWLDEANLAENLLNSGIRDLLTEPLRWAQVAPGGFLLAEALAARLLGTGEIALRLLPFLGSVLALLTFWVLVRRLLNEAGTFVAVGAMALNPLLISLGGALKQYSTDVAVAVLLLCVAVLLMEEGPWRPVPGVGEGGDGGGNGGNGGPARTARSRRWYWTAISAGSLGFISIPSILVAVPALLALAWRDRVQGPLEVGWWKERGLPMAIWGGLATIFAFREKAILNAGWGDFMREFWTARGSFLPPFLEEPFGLLEMLRAGLFRGLLFQPYIIGAGPYGILVDTRVTTYGLFFLVLLGAGSLGWLKRGKVAQWCLLLCGPLLLTVLFSRLRLYPLDPRTVAFLLPFSFLLLGLGTDAVTRLWLLRGTIQKVIFSFILLLPFLKVAWDNPPPFHIAPDRELIGELAIRRLPSEPVYGFWNSEAILAFYGERFGVQGRVKAASEMRLTTNLEEVREFRGQPGVWLVFPNRQGDEKDVFLCLLRIVGEETESVVLQIKEHTVPVSIHRFDFSNDGHWEKEGVESIFSGSVGSSGLWSGCEAGAST